MRGSVFGAAATIITAGAGAVLYTAAVCDLFYTHAVSVGRPSYFHGLSSLKSAAALIIDAAVVTNVRALAAGYGNLAGL